MEEFSQFATGGPKQQSVLCKQSWARNHRDLNHVSHSASPEHESMHLLLSYATMSWSWLIIKQEPVTGWKDDKVKEELKAQMTMFAD